MDDRIKHEIELSQESACVAYKSFVNEMTKTYLQQVKRTEQLLDGSPLGEKTVVTMVNVELARRCIQTMAGLFNMEDLNEEQEQKLLYNIPHMVRSIIEAVGNDYDTMMTYTFRPVDELTEDDKPF